MGSQSKNAAANGARLRPRPALAVLFLALLAAGGCHTAREAREIEGTLRRASTSVDIANTEETKRYAAAELAIADEKLAQARNAARAKEYELADRLVSESLVNVHLATTKAEAARIRAEVERMQAPRAGAPGDGRT